MEQPNQDMFYLYSQLLPLNMKFVYITKIIFQFTKSNKPNKKNSILLKLNLYEITK